MTDTATILAAFGDGDGRSPGQRVRDCVGAMFGVETVKLIGRSRDHDLIRVRHLAIWAVRQCCPTLSYPAIARLFGGRDHSTIINAVRKTEVRFEREPEFAALGRCIVESIGDRALRFTLDDDARARIAAAVAAMFPVKVGEVPAPRPAPAPSSTVRLPRNDFAIGPGERKDVPAHIAKQEDAHASIRIGTQALYAAIEREGLSVC